FPQKEATKSELSQTPRRPRRQSDPTQNTLLGVSDLNPSLPQEAEPDECPEKHKKDNPLFAPPAAPNTDCSDRASAAVSLPLPAPDPETPRPIRERLHSKAAFPANRDPYSDPQPKTWDEAFEFLKSTSKLRRSDK